MTEKTTEKTTVSPKLEIIRVTSNKAVKLSETSTIYVTRLYMINSFGRKLEREYTTKTNSPTFAEANALSKATYKYALADELVIFTQRKRLAKAINERRGSGMAFERLYNNLYQGRSVAKALASEESEMTNEDETNETKEETK